MHVGVGGAGHDAAGREQQRELVQPVAPRLEQQDEGDQDRKVGAGLRRDPPSRRSGPDPAQQEVRGARRHQPRQQGEQQPPEHQALQRQREHVVTDVPVELRIAGAEGHPVAPQQHRLPMAARVQPTPQRKDDHHAGQEGPQVPGELPRLAGRRRPFATLLLAPPRQPLRVPQVRRDERPRDGGRHHSEDEPGGEYAPEHPGLVDLTEPKQVGVEAGKGDRRPQEDEDAHRDHQGPRTQWTAKDSDPQPLQRDHQASRSRLRPHRSTTTRLPSSTAAGKLRHAAHRRGDAPAGPHAVLG